MKTFVVHLVYYNDHLNISFMFMKLIIDKLGEGVCQRVSDCSCATGKYEDIVNNNIQVWYSKLFGICSIPYVIARSVPHLQINRLETSMKTSISSEVQYIRWSDEYWQV